MLAILDRMTKSVMRSYFLPSQGWGKPMMRLTQFSWPRSVTPWLTHILNELALHMMIGQLMYIPYLEPEEQEDVVAKVWDDIFDEPKND